MIGLILLSVAAAESYDLSALEQSKASVPPTEENLEAGAALFEMRCAPCHGYEGAGDGAAAPYLLPRPRDFTLGLFKFRSTKNGELPTDADLYRIISRGVPGTAMPAWGEGEYTLSETERWQLVHQVKRLALYADFTDPAFDPYREDAAGFENSPRVLDEAALARGREIFTDENRGGCVRCHGNQGRGDGKKEKILHDDWGDNLWPADLTDPSRLKNGTGAHELFRTFSTGLNGTPMPSFTNSLDVDELWDLAAYVESLQVPLSDGSQMLLQAEAVEGEPPLDPEDVFWDELPGMEIPMTGQVIVSPRHQNHTVSRVWIRAAYGPESLAFHLSWNDRSYSDDVPDDATETWPDTVDDTYVTRDELSEHWHQLPDRVAVQLPVKKPDGPVRPHFFWGNSGKAVQLLTWRADTDEAEEQNAKGWTRLPQAQDEESQALEVSSKFVEGRWEVVLRRPLSSEDVRHDLSLAAGDQVPFALQVWDGGNGETGRVCSISSWYYLQLKTRTPVHGMALSGLSFLLSLGAIQAAVRWSRRQPPEKETT